MKKEGSPQDLKPYLNGLVERFERPEFIVDDPISIPHGFDDPLDREIIGLYAALLAWGRRSTIMANMASLCERMRFRPRTFVEGFDIERDGDCLAGFKHRTFRPEDAVWLTVALSRILREHGSLEQFFLRGHSHRNQDIGVGLQAFSDGLLAAVPEAPQRLAKHLARPSTGSACKRLSMYLRWMVRPGPVDFGQWRGVNPSQLVLPLDVHTGRQARRLGLLDRAYDDWRAVQELTTCCRAMDPSDPARYDFALFGLGVYGDESPSEETER